MPKIRVDRSFHFFSPPKAKFNGRGYDLAPRTPNDPIHVYAEAFGVRIQKIHTCTCKTLPAITTSCMSSKTDEGFSESALAAFHIPCTSKGSLINYVEHDAVLFRTLFWGTSTVFESGVTLRFVYF